MQSEFPGARVSREVVAEIFGGLPSFNQQAYSAVLGVGGTVLTSDNQVLFINRGASVSVNKGVSMTASGGVDYDKDLMSKYGIAQALQHNMARETGEELNLHSGTLMNGAMEREIQEKIGLDPSQYDLRTLGIVRELARGDSPEAMYGMDFNEMRQLIRTPGCSRVIHGKAVTNLMLMDQYLMSNSSVRG